MTFEIQHLGVCFNCSFATAYNYLSNWSNLTKWSSGLVGTPHQVADHWVISSLVGVVKIWPIHKNELGVLDFTIALPSGEQIYIPMRLISNGAGCSLILSLFRFESVSDEDFKNYLDLIRSDLQRLKTRLEEGSQSPLKNNSSSTL